MLTKYNYNVHVPMISHCFKEWVSPFKQFQDILNEIFKRTDLITNLLMRLKHTNAKDMIFLKGLG